MTKDTSIPAFPSMPSVIYDEAGKATTFPGMTLRQWYAGMALQGLVAAGYGSSLSFMSIFETHKRTYARLDSIPAIAFDIADQMLAASQEATP